MDPYLELINYIPSVGDACLADYATTHTILLDKKYFSNFTLAQSNVRTILGPIDMIKGSRIATIILPKGTKFQIEDALYSNKSSINLLSFKDIRRNGYHIETMNHDENEYLLITSIIFGQKCILEQLLSLSCGLYQITIRSIESPAFLERIQGDICGSIHPPSGHFRYFMALIDASTRWSRVCLLSSRNVAFARFADCHFDENLFPPLGEISQFQKNSEKLYGMSHIYLTLIPVQSNLN